MSWQDSDVFGLKASVQAHLTISGEWLDLGDCAIGLQPVNRTSETLDRPYISACIHLCAHFGLHKSRLNVLLVEPVSQHLVMLVKHASSRQRATPDP